MRRKVEPPLRSELWAAAEGSLSGAFKTVARIGWPNHDSDRRLARVALEAWLNEPTVGRPRDPQRLCESLYDALANRYDEPLLSAVSMLLAIDLSTEACGNEPIPDTPTH